MSFNLNNEKATGILIWWVEGADGSIEKEEEETVEEMLHELNYSMNEYRQQTKMFISGLSKKRMKEAVDEAIQWGAEHFDEQRKQLTIKMLEMVARSNEKEESEEENIGDIKQAWN